MFEFYINFLCAATAGERHYALVLNIGTFTEEEFLNMPRTLQKRGKNYEKKWSTVGIGPTYGEGGGQAGWSKFAILTENKLEVCFTLFNIPFAPSAC